MQQEDGKDGYILLKMDTCLSFLSLPPQLILSQDLQDSHNVIHEIRSSCFPILRPADGRRERT